MAGHPDLPKPVPPLLLRKRDIFASLARIDNDAEAKTRILAMESEFHSKIGCHLKGLPSASSQFSKFHTNPFVLMFYSKQKFYSHVKQIEQDLVPAKVFSSMETSAGNMVQDVVLPIYGWQVVHSPMHSHESLLDGRKPDHTSTTFVGATLKSGPRTLNDDMARNIGNELVDHAPSWAVKYSVQKIDFTYGVLYGTRKQSNKKDWHILRNIDEFRSPKSQLSTSHKGSWSIGYSDGPLSVDASVRIGIEWWKYLGGPDTWVELCCALIRSCIAPDTAVHGAPTHIISDMPAILDMTEIDPKCNVSILQKSQFEWLLFLARHFSDGFVAAGS